MMKSLRAKMTLLVLILGVPFLIASVQGLLFATEQNSLQERKSVAKRAINRLSRDLQGSNPLSRVAELYDQSGLDTLGAGATLLDRSGAVLWQSPHRAPDAEKRGAQQQILDEGVLLYVMPEQHSSNDLRMLAFAITGLGLVVYGVGAWVLVGATLRPISKLVTRVQSAKEDPNLVVTPPSTDREVVSLVQTLNALIHELRLESEDRINSYATLSHELRTPIHSLLLKLDLALGSEQSREEMEATLIEVQRQVYRLKNLSEAVLTLQGLSQSSAQSAREPLSVVPILGEISADLQPLMEFKGITLDVQVDDDVQVASPREHLVLLLRNLLENSVKHSPNGSIVTVASSRMEDGVELSFKNPASGETHLAGNGLGLRICREVARTNGWHLETNESDGAFFAEVRF